MTANARDPLLAGVNGIDLPDDVLGQLGNRVQHALRAFTQKDQKAVKAAAETMRQNPEIDAKTVITELRTGEALVSFLDGKGIPGITERAMIHPPESRLIPLTPEERKSILRSSPVYGKYEAAVDRSSAYELLAERAKTAAAEEKEEKARVEQKTRKTESYSRKTGTTSRKTGADTLTKMAGSAARAAGTQIGREIIRGILGSLTKK